jgi:hypothetical protein
MLHAIAFCSSFDRKRSGLDVCGDERGVGNHGGLFSPLFLPSPAPVASSACAHPPRTAALSVPPLVLPYSYVLCLCRRHRAVVLTLRGTCHPIDFLTDLAAEPAPFEALGQVRRNRCPRIGKSHVYTVTINSTGIACHPLDFLTDLAAEPAPFEALGQVRGNRCPRIGTSAVCTIRIDSTRIDSRMACHPLDFLIDLAAEPAPFEALGQVRRSRRPRIGTNKIGSIRIDVTILMCHPLASGRIRAGAGRRQRPLRLATHFPHSQCPGP